MAIAHRGGNALDAAREALRRGADMLETDLWLHNGRLEIRHMHRLGPVLWERWKLAPGWGHQLTLGELLRETPPDTLLFLDLKGDRMDLAPALLRELRHTAPGRIVAACGRNYPQLDPLRDEPDVALFYSVGEEGEWAAAWPRLEAMTHPAVSLRFALATPEVMERLHGIGATVVCWGVKTRADLMRAEALGVDGTTTENGELITLIARRRSDAPVV